MNTHDFKVGDKVYVVESDFKGRVVQEVVAVTDSTEMPIVVEMSGYVGDNVTRAFRPSELRHYVDVSEVEYTALILELVDRYMTDGTREELESSLMDMVDEIRFLAVCGDKAKVVR